MCRLKNGIDKMWCYSWELNLKYSPDKTLNALPLIDSTWPILILSGNHLRFFDLVRIECPNSKFKQVINYRVCSSWIRGCWAYQNCRYKGVNTSLPYMQGPIDCQNSKDQSEGRKIKTVFQGQVRGSVRKRLTARINFKYFQFWKRQEKLFGLRVEFI